MKFIAPVMLATAWANSVKWKKVRQKAVSSDIFGDVTVEFEGRAGKIRAYSAELGPRHGFVEMLQRGIVELDESGKELGDSWNLEKDFEWDAFEDQSSSSGKAWVASFGAVQYPATDYGWQAGSRQFALTVTATEDATSQTDYLLRCPNCPPPPQDLPGQGCHKLDANGDPELDGNGNAQCRPRLLKVSRGRAPCCATRTVSENGVANWVQYTDGAELPCSSDENTLIAGNTWEEGHTKLQCHNVPLAEVTDPASNVWSDNCLRDPDSSDADNNAYFVCTQSTEVDQYSTTFSMQVAAWDFASSANKLQYRVRIRSKLGGKESKKGSRRKNRRTGRWETPIELDGGALTFPSDATLVASNGDRIPHPCELTNPKTETASYVYITCDAFDSTQYTLNIVASLQLNDPVLPASAGTTAPLVATLLMLYALF